MNAAPISSPIARHGSVSAASSTASQSSPSQQVFVPPQPQQHRQQSGGTETFLRDFNLVAEAAKRAQMACLMRDMESCGLS
ncbi:hypothetical protein PFICI_07186 [Pestalotiopsis fici W106-1]|uniref:Uncharacterized protein n=1 Tax=Pestalotiopsis fici (strain W106-1 / CGMCC3.15140) TaxID=1229662 RepID=W3X825_PESFW|nr:uncharacterized protein PFICI_07186 [Pestalotiopsis fici W106-1]ETS82184.1 hypothetical protein PFICI_07186 [Pestalotiopsis fici W106-1]